MEFPRLQKLTEIKSPGSMITRLGQVKVGSKPDEEISRFLDKLGQKAESEGLKMVLSNPDNFSIDYDASDAKIKHGTNVWPTQVLVHEKGYTMHIMIDVDDIGGGSDNHEDVFFSESGKVVESDDGFGKVIGSFDEQEEWKRGD